jgi:hypothetical protein
MEDLITAPFAWCEGWEYTLPRPIFQVNYHSKKNYHKNTADGKNLN